MDTKATLITLLADVTGKGRAKIRRLEMNEFTGKPYDPSREKRVLVDLTEYVDCMQFGPETIKHYPLHYIAEALGWGRDDWAEYCDDIISGRAMAMSGVPLSSWLDIHCPDEGKVWRGGAIQDVEK